LVFKHAGWGVLTAEFTVGMMYETIDFFAQRVIARESSDPKSVIVPGGVIEAEVAEDVRWALKGSMFTFPLRLRNRINKVPALRLTSS
jgi:hypothetical protein